MAPERQINNSIVIPSNIVAVEHVCQQLVREVTENSYSEEDVFAIHLALEEALMNAAKHGNKLDVDKTVTIEYSITQDRFEIIITDQGQGFDPNAVPDPRNEENLYKYGGRGVLLMQSYMDKVEYNPEGTSVRMFKNRSTPA